MNDNDCQKSGKIGGKWCHGRPIYIYMYTYMYIMMLWTTLISRNPAKNASHDDVCVCACVVLEPLLPLLQLQWRIHMYIHIHMYFRIHIHMHFHMLPPLLLQWHIHMYIHIHMCDHIHMYFRIHMYIFTSIHVISLTCKSFHTYGVATINRLLKIIGLLQNIFSFIGFFCKRDLPFYGAF